MTTAAATDHRAFTAGMQRQWDAAADGWNAHTPQIRAWLHDATEAMCHMAGVTPGARVLDVAAGAGDQTLTVARKVGPRGHVLATDLSPRLVALARHNALQAGLPQVQTRVADGEDLGAMEAPFDAAVCRLGLMFLADPLQGLREMHRALRPGGGICTVVFSGPARNPCVAMLMATALRHAGLPPPDPATTGGLLSLGAPGRMDALMRKAGFEAVATVALDAPFHLPSVDDYLAFVRDSAGPILQILSRLDATAAEAAWAEMRDQLRAFDTAQGWSGPNELLLTAGVRPDET